MSVQNFNDLNEHYGHELVVRHYQDTLGNPINVAIECEDCHEVLLDYDKEGEDE
jgi:hypothetical protein